MSREISIQGWREALEALAQRNGSIELSLSDGDRPMHARLLEVDEDGSLLIERPTTPEGDAVLAKDAWVHVVVNHRGQRWCSRRTVLEEQRFALNDQTTVIGTRLGPAEEIVPSQRRQFFRASVDDCQVQVSLTSLAPDQQANSPHGVRLINISGGGVGVGIDASRETMAWLAGSRQYRCRIHLPDTEEPLSLPVRLIHVEPMARRTCYLGLAFEFETSAQRKDVQDQLARFTTTLQRQQLRRRRGA